jgi:hypothetical protein
VRALAGSLRALALLALAVSAPAGAEPPAPDWLGIRPVDPRGAAELRVREIAPLRFGRVVAGLGTRGEVMIDPVTGERSLRGGVAELGGSHSCAEYVVQGEPNARFTITLPQRSELEGPQGRVVLTDFRSSPSRTGVIGPRGMITVTVGATLVIEGAQPGGRYRTQFPVFLDFD